LRECIKRIGPTYARYLVFVHVHVFCLVYIKERGGAVEASTPRNPKHYFDCRVRATSDEVGEEQLQVPEVFVVGTTVGGEQQVA
jgi:hypothetical protein